MKRKIERHYEFTAEDIREALLEMLRVKDIPRPDDTHNMTWELHSEGAVLIWTDTV